MKAFADPSLSRGFRLLSRTLLRYRGASIVSVLAGLLWMVALVAGPYIQKIVLDRAVVDDRPELIGPLVGIFLAVGTLKALGIAGRRYFAFHLSYRAETDLRNRIFEHIQRLAFPFHDRTATGELMARASSDLSQVRLIFAMLPITVANIAMFVLVIVLLVTLDPLLGTIVSLAIPVLLVVANQYSRRVLAISRELQQKLADMSTVVEEGISGVRVVKAYGQEEQEVAKVEAVSESILNKTLEMIRYRSIFIPGFEAVPAAATVAVIAIGGLRVIDGVMSIGDFVAFTQYLVLLTFPLRITGWFFAELPRAIAAAARVTDLLAMAPEISDPKSPLEMPSGPGELRFSNVRFAYPDGREVFDGLELRIPGGTSVALVGPTGSGKTTLGYLVPRFYDPDEGSVLLDGVDIRQLRIDDLRSEVALVFEESFLFSATLGENIAFGNPEATDEHVRLAARLAQAHGFISELPDGYDTIVGERGLSLSGGQRQRIALARAVLRDPRVLILDDAMSAVDALTEQEIQSALEKVMEGRTTLIIAHRASTLALADRVVLIEDGGVAAVGTHTELLGTHPRYREVLAETGVIGEEEVV